MNLRILAAVAVMAAVTTLPTPASAAAPSAADVGCGLAAVGDPNSDAANGTATGEVRGGPVAQSGALTCTVQIDRGLHSDADVFQASGTGTGVTVVVPAPVSFTAPPSSSVYLCSAFTDASGTTWVLDDRDGSWVLAGTAGAACRLAVRTTLRDPVFDAAWDVICSVQRDGHCPPYIVIWVLERIPVL